MLHGELLALETVNAVASPQRQVPLHRVVVWWPHGRVPSCQVHFQY
jgi:hypothetical protein